LEIADHRLHIWVMSSELWRSAATQRDLFLK
jgi:hypothetical protein